MAIARAMLRCESMRVISHNDADGITSAGIICNALHRAGIPFHATLVGRLDPTVVEDLEGPVVFCDMGSGQPDLVSRVPGDVFVVDHHRPVGTLSCMSINPHQVGIDGAFEMSASGTAYAVARQMGENVDLSGLALVGAMGDRQAMIGANRAILEEAVLGGAVEVRPGLKMEDGDAQDVFEQAIEPLLDITGDTVKVREFLEGIGVSGKLQSISNAQLSRLSTALVLKMLMQGSFAADSIVGEVIRLRCEVVENAAEMVTMLNACGKLDTPGLGLTLCLRDEFAIGGCRKASQEYRRWILDEVNVLKGGCQELKNIRYLLAEDMVAGGVVAGLGIRYLFSDRPLLVLNKFEGKVKISARGNKLLVSQGLDLSLALRESAGAVGGAGGGHSVASGAAIPLGKEDSFLAQVDQMVGEQLGRSRAER